jgi:hypothetical protein
MAPFEIFVDDNFHYMDEEHRYSEGKYPSYEEALAKAKAIVEEALQHCHQAGMTSRELYESYVGFGEDPFIIPVGDPPFSAWEYARHRCGEICREEDAAARDLRCPEWPAEFEAFRTVLQECCRRTGLDEKTKESLLRFLGAVDHYPLSMPRDGRWFWLRLERGDESFTVYLHPDKFQLIARAPGREKVDWEVRFRGSGRMDRREGNASEAWGLMCEAASSPEFKLKIAAN